MTPGNRPAFSRTFFVSRHYGAIEWAQRQGLAIDEQCAHLDPEQIQPGDLVIGTLPIHLAARICARGGRYLHLALDVPAEARGRELSVDELERHHARLQEFSVREVPVGSFPRAGEATRA